VSIRTGGGQLRGRQRDGRHNKDVVCTFTNTREQGSIKVVKNLDPTGDPGRFNLFVKQARRRSIRRRMSGTTARRARSR
jgi:hypothetical protein